MDLNTVQAIHAPASRLHMTEPRDGDAYLAGGTWLFSEPQRHLRRLIDLGALQWPAIEERREGLSVAATCTFAELDAFAADSQLPTAPLMRQCCRALWGSFKIWNTATVGGNLCLALPAAPMAALMTALGGRCVIWCPDGADRTVAVADFITGPQQTCLRKGEVLRCIDIPAPALQGRYAYRQASLTEAGRSATLLVGCADSTGFAVTLAAASRRPLRLHFTTLPDETALADAVERAVTSAGGWFDDIHGAPDWRRHMTLRFASEIRRSL